MIDFDSAGDAKAVSVRLPAKLYAVIQAAAEERGVSVPRECLERLGGLQSSGRGQPLTDRQLAVLDFIEATASKRGYPPTVREIGSHFDIASPNGVMCHLQALEKKGWIARERNRSRAIRLV